MIMGSGKEIGYIKYDYKCMKRLRGDDGVSNLGIHTI